MKYFIFDSSNDGIVWIGSTPAIANRLKHGLLDCDLSMLLSHQTGYQNLAEANINEGDYKWSYKTGTIVELPTSAINDVYLEKKSLAKLRFPAFVQLMTLTSYTIRKIYYSPIPTVENDIAHALAACDPREGNYHYSVTEYSQICGMSEAEAFKELSLYTENLQSLKIRTHAFVEYFSNKINRSTSIDQVNEIRQEITKKFIKDNYI